MVVVHEMLSTVLSPLGHRLTFAVHGEQALDLYKRGSFDLVLADVDMKPIDGIELLQQLRAYDPKACVVIMTGFASADTAIMALKHGAFDYLKKPYKIAELMQALKRCADGKQRTQSGTTVSEPKGVLPLALVGDNPKVQRLLAQVRKLAANATPILLTGESGTGHEAVARTLHASGLTPEGPLVVVDSRHLSQAELSTGLLGKDGNPGTLVQAATGGTLFLQHPQALPASIQAAFVGVMRKSGSSFRLICATEEDLDALASEGRFNEEFYYRIASMPVALPSLRERLSDLPLLLKAIVLLCSNPHFESHQLEFADETREALSTHPWPGNLDELQQVVSHAIATAENRVIAPNNLPGSLYEAHESLPLTVFLTRQEKRYLARSLRRHGGDAVKAGIALGIDPSRFG